MDGAVFWLAALAASMAIGLGKGGVPVVSALAVPILSLAISPIIAAGLLLPVFIISDVFGLYAYRRSFDRDVLKIMAVVMPIGVLIGYLTANYVSEGAVTLIVGLIGFSFATSLLIGINADTSQQRRPEWKRGAFWGTITGFTSFVSHSGAVPFQVFVLPLKLRKIVFAGTATVAFAYINLIKLIPYYALGQLDFDNLRITAILVAPAVLSVFLGVWLVRVMPERLFFRLIVWALFFLSLRLIWDGSLRILA